MPNCSRCGAKGDDSCVYTAPRSPYYSEEELRGRPSLAAQFARVGTPTKKWHEERFVQARRDAERRHAEEVRRRRLDEAKEERRRNPVIVIHEAEAAWDREERRQLVWWLSRYADVLIGDSS